MQQVKRKLDMFNLVKGPKFASLLSVVIVSFLIPPAPGQMLANANYSSQLSTNQTNLSSEQDEPVRLEQDRTIAYAIAGPSNGDVEQSMLSVMEKANGPGEQLEQTGDRSTVDGGHDESSGQAKWNAQQVVADNSLQADQKSLIMDRRFGLFKKNQHQQPGQQPNYQMGAYYSECERCLSAANGQLGPNGAAWPMQADLPVVARYPIAGPMSIGSPLIGSPHPGPGMSPLMLPFKGKLHSKLHLNKPSMLYGEPFFAGQHGYQYQAARYRGPPIAANYGSPAPLNCVQSSTINQASLNSQDDPKRPYQSAPYLV